MDIRNFIRIDTLANTEGIDRINRAAEQYVSKILSMEAAHRRLAASTGAERVLERMRQAATASSTAVSNAVTRMQAAVQRAAQGFGSLVGPAQAGFNAVVRAAETAARRTADAFARLRIALPRIGIDSLRSGFTALAQAATAGFQRANAAVSGFLRTAQQAGTRLRSTFAGLSGIERLRTGFTSLAQAAQAGFGRASTAVTGFLRTIRTAGAQLQTAFGTAGIDRIRSSFASLATSARGAFTQASASVAGFTRSLAQAARSSYGTRLTVDLAGLRNAFTSLGQVATAGFQRAGVAVGTFLRTARTAGDGIRTALANIPGTRIQSGFASLAQTATTAFQRTEGAITGFSARVRTAFSQATGAATGFTRVLAQSARVSFGGFADVGRLARTAFQQASASVTGFTRTLAQAARASYGGQAITSLAQAATTGFQRAGAAVNEFMRAAGGAAGRFQSTVAAQFSMGRLVRDLSATKVQILNLGAAAGPVTRAFTNFLLKINDASFRVVRLMGAIDGTGAATDRATSAALRLSSVWSGVGRAINTAATAARNVGVAGRRFGAGLTGGPPLTPATAAAAGGWNNVNRAAYAAGLTMRNAGALGISALRGIAGAAATAGSLISGAIGTASIALGALGFISIRAGAQFEQSMNKIAALTDVPKRLFGSLVAGVNELTRTLPQSATELAQGLYFVISAGFDATEALDVLRPAAEAAAAAQVDLAQVADSVTSALLAYSDEGYNARQVTDILTKAVILGKTEFDTFAGSIGRVLPIGHQAGLSLEEVAASMTVMTQTGLSADESATALRAALNSLVAPAVETKDAFERLGTSADEVRKSIAERGFVATFKDLYDAAKGNIDVLDQIIPNIRGLTGALILAGPRADAYVDVLHKVENAHEGAGATARAFRTAMDTLVNRLKLVGNEIALIARNIYTVLAPTLKAIVEGIHGVVAAINDWIIANPKVFASIVRITAALTGLGAIAFGLPRLLQGASLFFGLFGAFGLTTVRSRQSLAALAGTMKALAPLFVILTASAIGLGKAFDIKFGISGVNRITQAMKLLPGTFAEVLSGVGDLFHGIITILGQPLPDIFVEGHGFITPLERIQAFVEDWQSDQYNAWMGFRATLGNVFSGIGDVFNNVAAQLGPILGTIGQVLAELAPLAAAALGRAITAMVEGGARFIDGLVRGLIQALPQIGEALSRIRGGIIDWIVQSIPVIARQIGRWVISFLSWVADVGPQIIAGLGSMLSTMLDWIEANSGRIASAVTSWPAALIGWVVNDAIPGLLNALTRLIDAVVKALGDTNVIARITAAVFGWVAAIGNAVIAALPQLIAGFATVVAQLTAFLLINGPKLALALIGGFLEGINRAASQAGPILGPLIALVGTHLVGAFVLWNLQLVLTAGNLTRLLVVSVARAFSSLLGLSILAGTQLVRDFRNLAVAIQVAGIKAGAFAYLTTVIANVVAGLQLLGGAMLAVLTGTGSFAAVRVAVSELAIALGGPILIALAAFGIAYATNFLGIRDITNNVVGWVIDQVGGLVDAVTTDTAEIASSLNVVGYETSLDQIREAFRTTAADIATGHFAVANTFQLDQFVDRVAEIGAQFGYSRGQALDFAAAMLEQPGALESFQDPAQRSTVFLANLERGMGGLATTWELTIRRIAAATAASGKGQSILDLITDAGGIAKAIPDWKAALEAIPQAEQDVADEIVRAREELLNAITGSVDEIQAAISGAQAFLGTGTKGLAIPPLDLSGLLRQDKIVAIKRYLSQVPEIVKGMDEATKIKIRALNQTLRDQILDLTFHLDTISANTGFELPKLRASIRASLAEGLDPKQALARLRRQLNVGATFKVRTQVKAPPKAELDAAVAAVKAKFGGKIAGLPGEAAGGFEIPITPKVKDIKAKVHVEVLADTSLGVSRAFAPVLDDIHAMREPLKVESKYAAGGIADIFKIESEPQSGPLVGITQWGRNMGLTIAAGLANSATQVGSAAADVAGRIGAPFILLTIQSTVVDGAYTWGLHLGEAFAAGLTASAPTVEAAAIYISGKAAQFLHSSIPDPASPLHDIQIWGSHLMLAWADGILSAEDRVVAAVKRVVGSVADVMAVGAPALAVAMDGGPISAAPINGLPLPSAAQSRLTDERLAAIMLDVLRENKLQNGVLARLAAKSPDKGGPLEARSLMEELRMSRPDRGGH